MLFIQLLKLAFFAGISRCQKLLKVNHSMDFFQVLMFCISASSASEGSSSFLILVHTCSLGFLTLHTGDPQSYSGCLISSFRDVAYFARSPSLQGLQVHPSVKTRNYKYKYNSNLTVSCFAYKIVKLFTILLIF